MQKTSDGEWDEATVRIWRKSLLGLRRYRTETSKPIRLHNHTGNDAKASIWGGHGDKLILCAQLKYEVNSPGSYGDILSRTDTRTHGQTEALHDAWTKGIS